MKINTTTSLSSSKVLLVPYSTSHVPKYHGWMQDPALQSATASEPLSLDAEYAMQRSWRTDGDKLTFIICLPYEQADESTSTTLPPCVIQGGKDDRPEHMVGDVNLFLFEPDAEDDDDDDDKIEENEMVVGELELMIARTDLQRKGYGRAALLVFIDYVLSHWDLIVQEYDETKTSSDSRSPRRLAYLRVKINASNVGSVRLFDSLGFQQTDAGANYFNEVELRWSPDIKAWRDHRCWVEWHMLQYNEAQL